MNVRRLENIIILLISLHSLILGVAMLFQPARMLQLSGWEYDGPLFFPAQSGLFLLLSAGVYFASVRHRKLLWFILASKTAAVAFLLAEYLIIVDAPLSMLIAALLDGLMAAIIAAIIFRQNA